MPRLRRTPSVQGSCFWRGFQAGNSSAFTRWTYSIESALHEWLLQSEHRVLDPDQADFFYAPVYTSCFLHPVLGWADYPWFYGPGGARPACCNPRASAAAPVPGLQTCCPEALAQAGTGPRGDCTLGAVTSPPPCAEQTAKDCVPSGFQQSAACSFCSLPPGLN